MTYIEVVEPLLLEVLGGIIVAMLIAVSMFLYRLWQLPALQVETVRAIRSLEKSVMRLAEVMAHGPLRFHHQEEDEDGDR